MELRHLQYFVAVAEERHFGRAAERLRIAQPGLSQQIKSLERSVGARLFDRGGRGVDLTEAGKALLDHARLILDLAGQAKRIPRLATEGKLGELRVGTEAVDVHMLANDVLEGFRERSPEVEVTLYPGFGPQHIEDLRRRTLDVAFVNAPFEGFEGLRYVAMDELELRVVLPEGHRLASLDRIPREELFKDRFIAMPKGANPLVIDHVLDQLFGDAEQPESIEVVDLTEGTRLQLVGEGEGFSVTLRPVAAELRVPGVVHRRLEGPVPVVEYGIAWFEGNLSPYVEPFVRYAQELVGSLREPGDVDRVDAQEVGSRTSTRGRP